VTSFVKRPTASADQLSPDEFISAAAEFKQKIATYTLRYVAFLGKAAYSALSDQRDIAWAIAIDSHEGFCHLDFAQP
jgi:double-stranded uracil-DNA glycosylase